MTIAERLAEYIKEAVDMEAFGFKSKLGCRDALQVMQGVIDRLAGKNFSIAALDLSKALDVVPRYKIWETILENGAPMKFVENLRKIHEKTEICAYFEGECSDYVEINKGVFQGSPISPLLFVICIDKMNKKIKKEFEEEGLEPVTIKIKKENEKEKYWNEKCIKKSIGMVKDEEKMIQKDKKEKKKENNEEIIEEVRLHYIAYADDTTLLAKDIHQLEKKVEIYMKIAKEFKMEVNLAKTQISTRDEEMKSKKERLKWSKEKLGAKNNRIKDNFILLGQCMNIYGFTKQRGNDRKKNACKQRGKSG